jgi:hypothetical protein
MSRSLAYSCLTENACDVGNLGKASTYKSRMSKDVSYLEVGHFYPNLAKVGKGYVIVRWCA